MPWAPRNKGLASASGFAWSSVDLRGLKLPSMLLAVRVLAATVSAHTVPVPGSHQSMCHFSFSQKFFSLNCFNFWFYATSYY